MSDSDPTGDLLAKTAKRVLARTRREGPVLRGRRCLVWQGARTGHGYGAIRVGQRVFNVHRLVYRWRHGELPEGYGVCHHCDNPPCVEDRHHFAGTQQDNSADMKAKGRESHKPSGVGEQHHNARLTEDDVRAIRQRHQDGATQRSIAAEFGVSHQQVSMILRNQRWSHVA